MQAIAALPCSEDLLDPASHAMDGLIPFVELAEGFLFVAAPHAGGDDPRDAALGTDSIAKIDGCHIAMASARIPYLDSDNQIANRQLLVPVDGVPLLRGLRVHCPNSRCGCVQRID